MSQEPASAPPEPAPPAPRPAPAAAPGTPWFTILAALVLGLGLRLFLAWDAEQLPLTTLPAWELEGVLTSLEAPPWPALNSLRPAAAVALHDRVAEALGIARAWEARLLGVGLSLVTLISLGLGAWFVSARLGFARRRAGPLVLGVVLLWALHPSGWLAARAPTWDAWLAALAPLVLVGLAWAADRRPWLGATVLGLLLGGMLAVGGVVWVAALAAGVLAFLLPVPRPAAALRALWVLALGVAVWAAAERLGPDVDAWRPDSAWSYAALEWLDPEHPRYEDLGWLAGPRDAAVRARVFEHVARAEPFALLAAAAERALVLGFSPGRLESLARQAAPLDADRVALWRVGLGVLDLLLRGGCLLFALTVLGLFRPVEPSSGWPRVAVCVGLLVLAGGSVLGATSPLGLLPVDALLMALAAAGLAGAREGRAQTRGLAFLLGGALLLSFTWVCGLRDDALDGVLWDRGERFDQTARLVELLEDPAPPTLEEEIAVANLYLDVLDPLLFQPELAEDHALEATRFDPEGEEPTVLLVRALAAQGHYEEAARLAQAAYEASGRRSRRLEILFDWVGELESRHRRPGPR